MKCIGRLPFFLRIDDVTEIDPRLIRIVDGAMEWGVPVLLSVIPSQITKATVSWLLEKHNLFPELLEIGQHGYRHVSYLKGSQHGEFCKIRNVKEQEADLKAGRHLMDNTFGEVWSRIFVPPFNCFTRCTVRLLVKYQYRGASAMHLLPQKPIDWMRAWRDLFLYRLGGNVPAYRNMYSVEGMLPCVSAVLDTARSYDPPIPWQEKDLRQQTEKLIRMGIPVFGIMIHHWIYKDMAQVEAFITWLMLVKQKENFVPVRVGAIMDQLR